MFPEFIAGSRQSHWNQIKVNINTLKNIDRLNYEFQPKPQTRQLNISTSYRKSKEAARKGLKPLLIPQLNMTPPAKDNNGQEAPEESMLET